jgi:hypothetical protein
MWYCMKCHEEVEDSFEVCWNCGTSVDGTEDSSFRTCDEERATDVSERTGPGEIRPESAVRTAGEDDLGTLRSLLFVGPLVAIPPILVFLFVTLVGPPPDSGWGTYRLWSVAVILLLIALSALLRAGLIRSRRRAEGISPGQSRVSFPDIGRSLAAGAIVTLAATSTLAVFLLGFAIVVVAPSALSNPDFRVEGLEFTAGVADSHLPVDSALRAVDVE